MSGIVVLSGFICFQGPNLWTEWQALKQERLSSQDSVVIGYPNISPNPSFAEVPKNWYHEEGEIAMLWACWEKEQGHRWYTIGAGEIDPDRLRGPLGRDVIRAIDEAIVEVGGGTYWQRIPDMHQIAMLEVDGTATGYPLRILQKVEVVNDLIDDRAYLVVYSPFVSPEQALNVYEGSLEGHRLTMGLSGYLSNRRAMLYDRRTESLWVEQGADLIAQAGPLKGARLRRLARPELIDWKEWKSSHPTGRLVVGADRS
ncbi:hypothetical protein BH23PLA1_BH23PLA1_21760 [soil metagenome]